MYGAIIITVFILVAVIVAFSFIAGAFLKIPSLGIEGVLSGVGTEINEVTSALGTYVDPYSRIKVSPEGTVSIVSKYTTEAEIQAFKEVAEEQNRIANEKNAELLAEYNKWKFTEEAQTELEQRVDVNKDGIVNQIDIDLVREHMFEKVTPATEHLDVVKDGWIKIDDLMEIGLRRTS